MKLFGYSISINVITLIGILYLIMVVNAISASCNMEGRKGRNKDKSDADNYNKRLEGFTEGRRGNNRGNNKGKSDADQRNSQYR